MLYLKVEIKVMLNNYHISVFNLKEFYLNSGLKFS